MKTKIILGAVVGVLFASCSSEEQTPVIERPTFQSVDLTDVSTVLATQAINPRSVRTVYESVQKFRELGLDEVTPLSEVMASSELQNGLRSLDGGSGVESSFNVDGLQIYWPNAEDWDGKTLPIITFKPENGQYIDGDKLMAYKYSYVAGGVQVDSLLIDEEYTLENPVWIINQNGLSMSDIERLKKGLPTSEGVLYSSSKRDGELRSTQSSGALVHETRLTYMQVKQQHDDWANGGSEFDIFWMFPTPDFSLSTHKFRECFSRKDIRRHRGRSLNHLLNTDWSDGQLHNRLKVVETDSGSSKNETITLSTSMSYKLNNGSNLSTEISGTFSATISIGRNDDHIMDYVIARSNVLTGTYNAGLKSVTKKFDGRGVYIDVTMKELRTGNF